MPLHHGPRHAPVPAYGPSFAADGPLAPKASCAAQAGAGAWTPRAPPTDSNDPAFSWVDQDFEEPFFD